MPLKLPRLPFNQALVDDGGNATLIFSHWWQILANQIESSINAITAAADAAAAAWAVAGGAQTTANLARQGVDEINLAISFVTDCTITATDAGADVTITISDSFRVYGDGTRVHVIGGSVAALPYSAIVYVYYSDPHRTGANVIYAASLVPADAAQIGTTHTIGIVKTPAAAGAPTTGTTTRPPGVGTLY